MPFTEDAQAHRDGIIIQSLVNWHVTKKKDLIRANEILGYLDTEPAWIEHPQIKKVNNAIKNALQSGFEEEQLAFILSCILEEISMEEAKPKPDEYMLHKLRDIYNKYKAA